MFKLNFNLSLLFSLFLLLTFLACNKEDETLSTPSKSLEIQESIGVEKSEDILKQKRKLVKETIECFDSNVPELGNPPFQVIYGELADNSIVYTDAKGTNTYVFPLIVKDKMENLFLVTENDESFLLEKTEALSLKDVEGTSISPHLISLAFIVLDNL